MATSCQLADTNQQITYTFRFGTSNKILQVTDEQLQYIPYLSLLVTHNNDFSSVRNELGEYVLGSRIRYQWFMPIFHAVTTGHPSALFTELSEKSFVWRMLQLYDYLCVNPIAVPLLKDKNLVRTKPDNIDEKKFRVEYSRANNLLEVCDTAAQFIISLSKNEYDLDDSNTLNSIYTLIMSIVSKPDVFGVRLCHHVLTVAKNSCFSLFSSIQKRELQMAEKSLENMTTHYDVHRELPRHFVDTFAWKGIHVPIKEDNNDNRQSTSSRKLITPTISLEGNIWRYRLEDLAFDSEITLTYFHRYFMIDYPLILPPSLEGNLSGQRLSNNYELEQEKKKMESKSARSGYFNTLPKRPKVDKFKHRSGPKAQKHR